MAYETGRASSAADLLTALQTFCTSNGWTLAGTVLSKSACYIQLTVSGTGISAIGGTGIDASNNLTGSGPTSVSFSSPVGANPLVYPVTFFFHALGNEFYGFINWSVDAYTFLSFGCSPFPGLPGTGCWYSSSFGGAVPNSLSWNPSAYYTGIAVDYNGVNGTGLFWCVGNASPGNGYVHHGLDGNTWTAYRDGTGSEQPTLCAKTAALAGPLMQQGLNTWNGQASLVPAHVYISRSSNMVSIVASLQGVRYINMGNLNAEQIFSIGSDRWKVYPFYRKGAAYAPTGNDSGWMAVAVQYDGP